MTKGYEYNKRWRLKNPKKRHEGKNRYYQKTAFAENHRKEWTSYELKKLVEWTGTDDALSKKLGRSVRAIQHKRRRIQDLPAKKFLE